MEPPERAQWTAADQMADYAKRASYPRSLTKAKKTHLSELIGLPIEATFDGTSLKSCGYWMSLPGPRPCNPNSSPASTSSFRTDLARRKPNAAHDDDAREIQRRGEQARVSRRNWRVYYNSDGLRPSARHGSLFSTGRDEGLWI